MQILNTVSANVEIRNTQLVANINLVQDNVTILEGGGTFFMILLLMSNVLLVELQMYSL
jgi:hypothetical protein